MRCYIVTIQNHTTGEKEHWEVEAPSITEAHLIARNHCLRHGGEIIEVKAALWQKS